MDITRLIFRIIAIFSTFLDTKFFRIQKVSDPRYLGQNFFGPRIFLDTKFFRTQNIFGAQNFVFGSTSFGAKLLTNILYIERKQYLILKCNKCICNIIGIFPTLLGYDCCYSWSIIEDFLL